MGKKTKLPFLLKATETAATAAPSWPWPTCASHPKTLSFRSTANPGDTIFKTLNSAYFHDPPEQFLTNLEENSFSGEQQITDAEESAVVGGLTSDRLFFEPGETNSILEEAAKTPDFPYKDNVSILAMDSNDPFFDFRVSMEEMVAAHGLKDWECLEELLTCYLRINGKSNHGYVIGAFVDMLLNLSLVSAAPDVPSTAGIDERCSSSSDTSTTLRSFTSPPSSFYPSSTSLSVSPCLSSLENEDVVAVEKTGGSPPSASSSCIAESAYV